MPATTSSAAPRVCVIGAGPSGLAAVKALHTRGIDVTCFESRDRVGGLWAIGDDEVQASYPSLECNTSKTTTQFSDLPMPRHFPAYPHNTQMDAYLNDYVDHFGFRERIHLGTTVVHAAIAPGGGWDVRVEPGGTLHFDQLVVANGHHRVPRRPDPPFPGEFSGRQIHAHDYTGPNRFAGGSAVVLGMGNSAMDIAVELSGVADAVYLASRRGAHIAPKFAFGQPIDRFNTALPVPWPLKRAFFDLIVRGTIGRPEDVGLPKPDHRLGEAHPTVSQRIIDRVRSGAVVPKPNIDSFHGDRVRFTDGTEVTADLVVYCTGYNVSFPFLDDSVLHVEDNRIDLFHHVFHPDIAAIAFIGLVQPFGALIPVAELQSEWVADHLTGGCRLPSRAEMRHQVDAERRHRERRFVASPRHTMEIDLHPYLRAIRRERRRGALRAAHKPATKGSRGPSGSAAGTQSATR